MTRKLYFLLIIGQLIAGDLWALPDPSSDPRVKSVYEYLQDQLIWIKDGSWTSCGKNLMETLLRVEEEGLRWEDYAPLLATLQKAEINSLEGQRKADELLTLLALNYISDMKGERLKPQAIAKEIYIKPQSIDEAKFLKKYVSLSNQCGWINNLAPSLPEYQHFKQTLSLYRQKKAQGGWPELPKGTKLEKGDKGSLVETLRAQLIAQDALSSEGQGSDIFDESLEEALKNYQVIHGLEPDGKVGGATLTALNTSVDDRIRAIIVSLERLRWLPSPLPARYIQVNVPGFYLKAVDGGTTAFFMPIITGKEYSKTPVFNAPMTDIIFNPAWHVPSSIIPEILPQMHRNPEAFARKGYHMSEGRIVQSPGPANSLGKIKFNLKNPFAIYLHGTPNQKLFQKAKRSLSHGCIRVEDPAKLAEFVFHDPEWTLERIKAEASGSKTKHQKLESSLPVFITYFTVFEDENHKIHFVNDEYHQDKKMWEALENTTRMFASE